MVVKLLVYLNELYVRAGNNKGLYICVPQWALK